MLRKVGESTSTLRPFVRFRVEFPSYGSGGHRPSTRSSATIITITPNNISTIPHSRTPLSFLPFTFSRAL